jgi:hypothetical protein
LDALDQVRAVVTGDVARQVEDLVRSGETFPTAAASSITWWLGEVAVAAAEGAAVAAEPGVESRDP